jgi:tRNA threonylcarbamoyladenosine dehydratase
MMSEKILSTDIIDRIVYYGTLAPSPHNVQGWKFRFDGNVLEVLRDSSRTVLRELDPEEKEGMIAIGAAVENVTIAAEKEGFKTEVEWFPRTEDSDLIALVKFVPGNHKGGHELFPFIEKRTVNRSLYKKDPIPDEVLVELQEIACKEGFQLKIVTDRKKINDLAIMAGEAGSIKFSHEPTHRELYDLLRFTPKDIAKYRDGLPLEQFFIPSPLARVARYVMKWNFVRIFNLFGYNRALSYFLETQLVKSSPAVCLLVAKDGGACSYLNGGRVFQRISLAATRHGISLQPHSAIADLGFARVGGYHDSIPEKWRKRIDQFPNRLRELFAYEGDPHVINLFRLGYPTKVQHKRSPRRNLEEVLEIATSSFTETGDEFSYKELTTRNYPFISNNDQLRLKYGRIALAGCGSIGGAPLETLVRMGAERFILAEPGTYELNNLNRQKATLSDIGKNKAEVILNRVKKINPFVIGHVLSKGVNDENVHYIIGSSEVIIDGIDITETDAIRAKILLHQEAWRQRRPVISGYDIAGTQLVKIYDYRLGKIAPLDGRLNGVDIDSLTPLSFLSMVISPLDIPKEMLPVTDSLIRGSQISIPQLGPTAELFGVLSSWAALDLLSGRPVRKKIRIDIPDVLRPLSTSTTIGIKRLWGIIQIKALLIRTTKRNGRQLNKEKQNRFEGKYL